MNRIGLLLEIFILGAILFACAPKITPVAPVTEKPSEVAAPVTKTGLELEWEKTLEAARNEGRVVIHAGAGGIVIRESANLFKQKYGVAIEFLPGRARETVPKLFRERASKIFVADIFIGGMNNLLGELKPAGVLDPLEPALILPEVTDPKGWFGGKLPWGDEDRTTFMFLLYTDNPIGVNTRLAKPKEIKSYYDLIDPKWKDKILMDDPTISGSPFNSFSSLIYNKVLDLDFFRQLVQQQPMVIRDKNLSIDWVAKGKYSVALWPTTGLFHEYQQAGAPIAYAPTPKEGTWLSSGGGALGLLNRAPHPNASKVLINWFLSREEQIKVNHSGVQSARDDIPTEGIDPQRIRRPGEKYFLSANAIEEWYGEQDRYQEMARQIFGSLIR